MSADTTPVIEGRDITMRFGGLVALSSVTIHVPPASIVGLVGPNGAGKSTLFAVLSGLLNPTAGQVFMNGRNVTATSPQARARHGLARTFQQPELFLSLTVREHVQLAYRVRHHRQRLWTDLFTGRALRRPDSAEVDEVDGLIRLLDLSHVAQTPVAGLPLGLTRRVEVARALATSPSVLLLDEPVSGLDSRETAQFCSVLEQVVSERGVSMLLVEHDVAVVLGLSKWVFVLDFGALIAQGTPEAIRSDPAVRAAYLGHDEHSAEKGRTR